MISGHHHNVAKAENDANRHPESLTLGKVGKEPVSRLGEPHFQLVKCMTAAFLKAKPIRLW